MWTEAGGDSEYVSVVPFINSAAVFGLPVTKLIFSSPAACERNSAAMVATLLNHGVAVNTHCIQGWTALQEAVCRNNIEICEMLLKAGAKHNLSNMYGISPLFTAAQSGQLAALRYLLRHGT